MSAGLACVLRTALRAAGAAKDFYTGGTRRPRGAIGSGQGGNRWDLSRRSPTIFSAFLEYCRRSSRKADNIVGDLLERSQRFPPCPDLIVALGRRVPPVSKPLTAPASLKAARGPPAQASGQQPSHTRASASSGRPRSRKRPLTVPAWGSGAPPADLAEKLEPSGRSGGRSPYSESYYAGWIWCSGTSVKAVDFVPAWGSGAPPADLAEK